MGFSAKQVLALRRNLKGAHIRTKERNGRELSYVEAWHAIAEANRIFGFDGWDRETIETRCVSGREVRGTYHAVYTAKVRITVHAGPQTIVREGHGTGEGHGASLGDTHDIALKAAETDATKRALATFGKPFGLALYLGDRSGVRKDGRGLLPARAPATAPSLNGSGTEALQSGGLATPARPQKEAVQCGPDLLRPLATVDGIVDVGPARRIRDREHLKFVTTQACLFCGRCPSDAHHLTFAQPRALGMKVSDEFTVPLCRLHHREVHQAGNERKYWADLRIEPLETAKSLWDQTLQKRNRLPVAQRPA